MLMGAMLFSACSSDDDEGGNAPVGGEVSVSKVFTGGLPKKASEIESFVVDSENRVTSMTTGDGTTITFEYDAKTRAASKNVHMTIDYGYDDTEEYNLTLGANGFIVRAEETPKDYGRYI